MYRWLAVTCAVLAFFAGCAPQAPQRNVGEEVQEFIDNYTTSYVDLVAVSAEAQWASNTLIIDGVNTIDRITNVSAEALSRFTGSKQVIEKTREYLKHKDQLTGLQVKQLESILYKAGNNPQTVPDLVTERIAAETAQVNKLFGFTFKVDGKEVTPNSIDQVLSDSNDLKERLAYWEASKEVGVELKDGLANLVQLRNKTVQALDYQDYFHYQVSEYGMTTDEMMTMMHQFMVELRPLYRELHTWARYTLAEKYGVEPPDMLPAHWLPNRWGQDWSSLVTVEGIDLDGALEAKGSEWLVKQAERFYVSLGFEELPQSFYDKSSLYPVGPDAGYKKNTHASAWHMDLTRDVRSLMSVEPNARWYETTHHELGHIYYYLCYTNPDVPPLLRGGANRAFHEGVGSLMGMASMHKPFLQGLELIPADAQSDDMQALFKEALANVVFMPFSAGTMSHFERDLYARNLSKDEYNKRWWEYAAKYQGIAPPADRGEQYCDAATKTHINDDAAQYYDYAMSYIILFQLHDHISKNILKQNMHQTNYFGNKEVGQFLTEILKTGSVKDWREVMRDALGQDVSAAAMVAYYQPLVDWLKTQNEGRTYTLPEL